MTPSKWKGGDPEKRKAASKEYFDRIKQSKFDGKTSAEIIKAKTEPHELPGWVRRAFTFVELQDLTYAEIEPLVNRKASTIGSYAKSPAVKKWREALREVANDPAMMAKGVLEGAVADAAAYMLWALEAAKLAGDYKEARIIAAEILDRLQLVQKSKEAKPSAPPTIHLHLPAGTTKRGLIEVESEVIEEAVVERIE